MSVKDKITYYRQHSFVRNVALLQSGTFVENVIQALVGVFLARLLQPELFGVYALVFSLAGLASLFLGVGAQEAITTVLGETYARQDREKTKEALAFLLKISVIMAAIVAVAVMFAPLLARLLYHQAVIGWYAALVVAAVIISTSFFSLSSLILQVSGRIKGLMALGIVEQSARYGLSLLFVLGGLGVAGAVSGHLLGAAITFVISLIVWEKLRRQYPIFPSVRQLLGLARRVSIKKYLGFSFWVAVDRNVANLYGLLPVLLVGIFVSSSQVTFFKLSFAYLNLAMSLLGPVSTLLNVEFPKMKIEGGGRLGKSFVKVSLYSLGLSAALTAGALLVAPWAFRFFYGVSFLPSIKYVYGLFIYGSFFGIGVGLGPMWRAINKVKVSILINAITLGLGIPLGLWLIKNFNLWGAVAMVTIWFTVSHLVSFIYLTRKLNKI